jgi:hypothetical protein
MVESDDLLKVVLFSSFPQVDGGCMPGLSATLTILSLTASLGNILRLPRVVYLSGGGKYQISNTMKICVAVLEMLHSYARTSKVILMGTPQGCECA